MKKKWEKIKIRLAIVICILTIISTVWVLISRLEGKPPEVLTRGLSEAIRASQDIAVSVSDPDSGLRSIRITLLRGRTESVLYEKTFSAGNFLTGLLTGGISMKRTFS
ncbi:M23 family peptidase [Desulfonema ishimotonii]|uniref:M23 family peptidase n=1 Tax=Desulfonema ishimotonii TaxID=45657 RepID=A0A401G084_9BACT|nr:hypothetical protein [Desulfonema ishimotonii]GBC62631.1 M23 family peptidase [Desulfonema ishimotonii]